jgi:hypothetical protein
VPHNSHAPDIDSARVLLKIFGRKRKISRAQHAHCEEKNLQREGTNCGVVEWIAQRRTYWMIQRSCTPIQLRVSWTCHAISRNCRLHLQKD